MTNDYRKNTKLGHTRAMRAERFFRSVGDALGQARAEAEPGGELLDRAAAGGRFGEREVTRPYRRSIPMPCERCGHSFIAEPHKKQRFCGVSCRNGAHDDETIRTCRYLWGRGMSISAIGVWLNVTRNVVVGIAHRNQFPARPSPIKRVAA